MNLVNQFMGYFTAENSSLGQSYLCEQYENGSFDLKRCFFIFHKQFRDDSQFYLSVIEGVILIALSLLIVPANVVALHNFNAKRLNPDFKLLLTMLCIYNFAMAIVGVINGISRFTLVFPMGYIGCSIFLIIGGTVNTCTAYTMTWLSIERRRAICTAAEKVKRILEKPAKRKMATWNTILTVVLTTFLSIALWSIVAFYFEQCQLHSYEMPSGITAQICVTKPYLMANFDAGGSIFSLVTFFIPLVMATFNFG